MTKYLHAGTVLILEYTEMFHIKQIFYIIFVVDHYGASLNYRMLRFTDCVCFWRFPLLCCSELELS